MVGVHGSRRNATVTSVRLPVAPSWIVVMSATIVRWAAGTSRAWAVARGTRWRGPAAAGSGEEITDQAGAGFRRGQTVRACVCVRQSQVSCAGSEPTGTGTAHFLEGGGMRCTDRVDNFLLLSTQSISVLAMLGHQHDTTRCSSACLAISIFWMMRTAVNAALMWLASGHY